MKPARSRAVLLNLSAYGLLPRMNFASLASGCLRAFALADREIKEAVDISFCDASAEEDPRLVCGRIERERPDLVGFSCYTWNAVRTQKLAAVLKKRLPRLPIVFGGPEAGGLAREYLDENKSVDFVATAEGEETFRKLLRFQFLKEGRLDDVPGLAFRAGERIVVTAEAPLVGFERLPAPYSGGCVHVPKDPPFLVVETSRGCPFSCSFCDWGPKRMRYAELERIEAEFRTAALKNPVIYCADADLLMSRDRALSIMRTFLRVTEGLGTVLAFDTNPKHMWPEIADLIAEAPRRFHPTFGLQSVVPEVLKLIDRPFDRPATERRLAYFKKRCPTTLFHISVIFGLPGDNLAGFRQTLEWALQYRPLHLCAHHCAVLPDSDLHRTAAKLGFRYQPEPPHLVTFSPTMPRKELEQARWLAYLAFIISMNPKLNSLLFDAVEGLATRGGSRVDAIERWAAFVSSAGIDLACGQPVTRLDDYPPVERADYASRLLMSKPQNLAALMHATRLFAAAQGATAVSAAGLRA